jgi:tRNA modification GTPase
MTLQKREKNTIIAPITAASGGSVSLIRLSGKDAFDITLKYFSNKQFKERIGNRIYSGYLKNRNDSILDQVVVSYFKNPKSYTGEDIIEISFHANPIIINSALDLFINEGCRYADPGEFTQRAFINGKIDLVQAEAVADLINAKSKRVLNNSIKNLDGVLSKEINNLKEGLINTASLLELDLDFTEEDLEIIKKDDILKNIEPILKKITQLSDTYQHNKILNKGIEILIIGKPNVGKSSLMNSLIKSDRVIVSDIPGTTRDTIHEDVIQNGHIVRYIDTAGIHYTDNKIEIEGVERAKKLIKRADILLLILDLSNPFNNDDIKLFNIIEKNIKTPSLIIGNKTDKEIYSDNLNYIKNTNKSIIKISVLKNIGLDKLKENINNTINSIDRIDINEIYISNFRHYEALNKAKEYLKNIIKGVNNSIGYEFLALDLRQAIEEMSEILGEVTTDDILNNIFSHYCIGK